MATIINFTTTSIPKHDTTFSDVRAELLKILELRDDVCHFITICSGINCCFDDELERYNTLTSQPCFTNERLHGKLQEFSGCCGRLHHRINHHGTMDNVVISNLFVDAELKIITEKLLDILNELERLNDELSEK